MDENLTTQVEVQAEPTMDETISSAWSEISTRGDVNRDDSGKFSGKEQAEEPAEVASEVPAEAAAEEEVPLEEIPQEPAIKAPSSWKKDAQAKFAALDPDIQAEVLRRENDMHKGIETYKQHAERAQSYERAFQPYMDTINKLGIAPEVAASELMKVDHSLRYGSPADKVAMVQKIITDYGINPEWFDVDKLPQANPQVDYLQSKLQAIEAQQAKILQETQAREESSLNSDIQAFAKNNEHFEAVRDRMANLIQGAAAAKSSMTLQEAYDTAIWADPSIRATMLAKQQADDRARADLKAKEAKKAASVNMPRRGTLPAQAVVGSMDDTIRAAAKSIGMI